MNERQSRMRTIWDERYAEEGYAYGDNPNEYFSEKITLLNPGAILLPAEGEGRNAAYAAIMDWKVTAFDQSEEGRKKALMLAEETHVKFEYLVGDAMELKFASERFDAIGMIYAHFPLAIKQKLFPRLAASLKSGGHLILEGFGKRQLEYQPKYNSGGPKDPDMLFEMDEIRRLFPDFQILELLEGEVLLDEGKYHQGPGWVVRFFGRKR